MRLSTLKLGRKRRLIGLTLLAAGLLFTAACVASAKWWVGYCSDTWLADFGDGTLYTRPLTPGSWFTAQPGWYSGPNGRDQGKSWQWTWWVFGDSAASGEPIQAHSVWPLAPAVILIGGAFYFAGARARRRARRDQCQSCGYSLAGLPAATSCPECGTEREPSQQPHPGAAAAS